MIAGSSGVHPYRSYGHAASRVEMRMERMQPEDVQQALALAASNLEGSAGETDAA